MTGNHDSPNRPLKLIGGLGQKREEHWFIHRGVLVSDTKMIENQDSTDLHYNYYCGSGEARVTIDNAVHTLSVGQYIDVPRGSVHRIENTGKGLLVFIEIQSQYLSIETKLRLGQH